MRWIWSFPALAWLMAGAPSAIAQDRMMTTASETFPRANWAAWRECVQSSLRP